MDKLFEMHEAVAHMLDRTTKRNEDHKMTTLHCDMDKECAASVTHVDVDGYVYCQRHGEQRKSYKRCRKLRPAEKRRLQRGRTITY